MAFADIKQGVVLVYPYLWQWQAERGETAGRKDRPVCIALPLRKGGVTHIFLLAITGTRPADARIALKIPDTEKRRAGLKEWKEGWVIVDECNYDIAEHSYHLNLGLSALGRFSEAFTGQIKDALRNTITTGSLRRIDRAAD